MRLDHQSRSVMRRGIDTWPMKLRNTRAEIEFSRRVTYGCFKEGWKKGDQTRTNTFFRLTPIAYLTNTVI